MKLSSMILIAVFASGCSTAPSQYHTESAISLEQLQAIKVADRDCPTMNRTIAYVEKQLRLRGIDSEHPEKLNASDTAYNSTAKIIIWSLRIGCNNPNRYRS
jgi:hypothetical protein